MKDKLRSADAGARAAQLNRQTVMKHVPIFLLSSLCSVALFASAAMLSQIEGRYEVESSCSVLGTNGYESCGPEVHDHFELTALTDQTASFELFSIQTNGHSCEVSGTAEVDGDSLIYVDKALAGSGQGLRIKISSRDISFVYLKPVPAHQFPPYCGTRASIERIRFPLDSKVHE